MGRDTIQLENVVSTISQEDLLEFTSEYGIPESLHPELPGPTDPIMEFPEGKRYMDLFCLISPPNLAKVKTRTRLRVAHEVMLLTAIANFVIDMEDMTGESGSSGTPNPPYTEVAPEPDLEKETVSIRALVNKRRRKRGPDKAKANAPPKVLRKDHVASHLSQSTLGGKSLAAIGIRTGSTVSAPATQETPVYAEGVSDPDPLSSSRKAVVTKDPDSKKSASFTSMVGSPGSIYQLGWGVTNNCRLDTVATCQDMVDHIVPPGYFSELRHLPNDEFLNQYNIILARQVAMGSQLRLRFEQETKLLKKAVAQVARRDQRIQAMEKHIKNLGTLLEAEADMKDIAEAKNVELVKELEIIHVFADVVSVRIAKGMSEGLKHGVEHGKARVDLAAIEAYDHEVDTKYSAALHTLKDLKYPLVDQLEKLKDAPKDVIMSSLYLESDSGVDA
uniref:Transposase (Putative), gypsy type n=1 Tax=Tanacetum cinerariifolium TaxID=118510 RepID=A0A699HUA5_TANCI|nr:hypothetical protein [Tanacetum cinerariifolium]